MIKPSLAVSLLFIGMTVCGTGLFAFPAADTLVIPCQRCESLRGVSWPDVRIDSVAVLDKRGAVHKGGNADRTVCQLIGVIGSEISFELLLPASWNARFVMGGGGGFVGTIMNRARNMAFDGYATVGTDTGHKGADAAWALNNMERQLNFGHLAIHRTAETAKAIIRHYYARPPRYSYFIGLSRGGGQGMMEAQRHPDDFDGIVAGAPAFNWVGMATKFIRNTQALYPDPAGKLPVFSKNHLRILQEKILERCDLYDGVRDAILANPLQCDFELDRLPLCKGDTPDTTCFTAHQIGVLKDIYKEEVAGQHIVHAGFPYGGENDRTGWFPSIVGLNKGSAPYPSWQAFFGLETYKYLVFNSPEWGYGPYQWEDDFANTRYAAAYLNATKPDYGRFKAGGGKMILYQGWIDPLISALDLIRHYKEAKSLDPDLESSVRLFMLPGVTHTGGNGPGKADWFRLIADWVEKGVAPERVIVSKTEEGKVMITRPVYPYPRVPEYDGTGDPNLEGSFR